MKFNVIIKILQNILGITSYGYAHKRAVDSHLMNMFYGILNEICFLRGCLLIDDTIQIILDSIKDEAKNKFKQE